ncbi:helix-turn-helix domain-containing protein [Streptomyces sp. NBC_00083]|uniref:helix-turn-helix domain-containing protein n=1 Tax=Streptomyces sp. NBC_00083 TaxID=2975647 RepID=UPI002255D5C1|nr:helix-turn-helix domain-containing protein [Streptomyces sp. NBC_00083]MCX5386362.1 helix-turn-helix domain-containing protein [Streptomyces sp. NBC_00083]
MYRERPSRLAGAVVWTRTIGDDDGARPVLPDGCMDLLWCEGRLLVAGPDTRAHVPEAAPGTRYAGIRFAPGTGPGVLGVPAHAVRDARVALDGIWAGPEVRRLAELIGEAAAPAAALEAVALDRAPAPDPLARAVAGRIAAGWSVTATAADAGLGARQLHRRCLDAFGYGPKTLARVLRLQRALDLVRRGVPYAEAALAAGCADQAHLSREMRSLAGMTLGEYAYAHAATDVYADADAANSDTSVPSGSRTVA